MPSKVFHQLHSMSLPLISVIMPAYNRQQVIGEAINSVQNQTYPHWELIVVDDGSTDSTYAVAHRYAKSDSRIKLYRNEQNNGISSARNTALKLSRGKFITHLDSDDTFSRSALADTLAAFKKWPSLLLVHTDLNRLIDGKVVHTPQEDITYNNWLVKPHGLAMVMYSREAVNLSKKFEDQLHTCEDINFYDKILKSGRYLHLKKPLYNWRIWDGSITRNTNMTCSECRSPHCTFFKNYQKLGWVH